MRRTSEVLAITLLSATVGLSACTGPGSDRTFTIQGEVVAVDHDQLTVGSFVIEASSGDVASRLDNGVVKIDDNYKDISCVRHETSDALDTLLDERQIAVGSIVRVSAEVGISTYNCIPGKGGLSQTRSMLDQLSVIG